MKKMFMAVSLIVLGMLLVGCAPSGNGTDPVSVVKANMMAFQNKDVNGYMTTISPNTPGFAATKQMIGKLFQMYDFKVELKDLKVVSQGTTEAKVSFTQVMKKVKGPDFKDNTIEGVHTLVKGPAGWQILNTEIKSFKYL